MVLSSHRKLSLMQYHLHTFIIKTTKQCIFLFAHQYHYHCFHLCLKIQCHQILKVHLSFHCYLTSLKYHWFLIPSCYLRPRWHTKVMLVWKVQYWTRLINLPKSTPRPSDGSTNHVLYAGTLQNSCICGWV